MRRVTDLAGEGDGLVGVGLERADVVGGGGELGLGAVAGDADAGEEAPVLVERHAAGGGAQAGARYAGDAVGLAEVVDVRIREVGEAHAHQRAGRAVAHARREVLLDDEARGARGEGLLVGAEEDGGAGLGDGDGALLGGDAAGAVGAAQDEFATVAVHYGDDGARKGLEGLVGGLLLDAVEVGGGVGRREDGGRDGVDGGSGRDGAEGEQAEQAETRGESGHGGSLGRRAARGNVRVRRRGSGPRAGGR